MDWSDDIEKAIEQYEEDVLTLIKEGFTQVASEKLEEVISLMEFAYQEIPTFENTIRLRTIALIDRWDQLQDVCTDISDEDGIIIPNLDIVWLLKEHLKDIEEHLEEPEASPTVH